MNALINTRSGMGNNFSGTCTFTHSLMPHTIHICPKKTSYGGYCISGAINLFAEYCKDENRLPATFVANAGICQ